MQSPSDFVVGTGQKVNAMHITLHESLCNQIFRYVELSVQLTSLVLTYLVQLSKEKFSYLNLKYLPR